MIDMELLKTAMTRLIEEQTGSGYKVTKSNTEIDLPFMRIESDTGRTIDIICTYSKIGVDVYDKGEPIGNLCDLVFKSVEEAFMLIACSDNNLMDAATIACTDVVIARHFS